MEFHSKLTNLYNRSQSELDMLRLLYAEMERIAGATTMTVDVVALPRNLVDVLGDVVSARPLSFVPATHFLRCC